MSAAQRFREFRMPDVGEGLTEAEILKWLVQPGDTVSDGQVVVEVETAKAAVELPIPYDGVVREVHFPEGRTVDVGTPIITVDTDPSAAEPAPEQEPSAATAAEGGEGGGGREPVLVGYGVSTATPKRRPRRAPAGGEANRGRAAGQAAPAQQPGGPAGGGQRGPAPADQGPAPAGRSNGWEPAHLPGGHDAAGGYGGPALPQGVEGDRVAVAPPRDGRPLAKPPVRKLAKDLGVDLATVIPSGPNGVVTREDVHAAVAPRPAPTAAEAEAAAEAAAADVVPQSLAEIRERRVPIKGVRKATAQAMVGSAFTAPHVTEFVTIDVTRTVRLVERLRQDPDMAGLRVNALLLVAKALLVAIRRNPEINAAWDEDRQEIVYKEYVNLGIAAATPRGLIVPNIKDAGAKTLPELASALSLLVNTARDGRTAPGDMRGGTVTITNIGVFGIDTGTPILNPGESAILAFGAIRQQPWVHKGKVKPRHVTTLALSFDHRLVDGELGSRVLADVAAVLEHPRRLITWS
ncbi:dihydrolipoamide acetyltransferase family protein [Streptomyces millisiae]|uniref:Dihydrolipoamide acetyltransferase component of pyruvate dehydrogenase complex n=1 Tax=Streptomyces millisiae TaxID=3075542 RepID=A0ABU2LUL7_9ACTN|nr:dihydrolipoamide acetyltransferase family protein [Streptomyces sp. DSM 44918]MDT0320862.1 dihydrolipoamide acetyltransferase family protein [Streptomyces sp. DSM 44918]